MWKQLAAVVLASSCLFFGTVLRASNVAVRYKEGITHGFLLLSTLDGTLLAVGDLIQTAHGNEVTSRLTYHFKDGSLQDETTVFSQRDNFSLNSYHLVQKGATFPSATDLSITRTTGEVTVRYTDDKGQEKVDTEHMKLPSDLSNGLVLTILKNLRPGDALPDLSFLVATPKPRIVKLSIRSGGDDAFSLAGSSRKAVHYILKVEIGGVTGLLAELLKKQPPDSHVWIVGGEAPTFVKSETLSYFGGPMWRTELTSPVWPKSSESGLDDKH
jgi:hypothetical protein